MWDSLLVYLQEQDSGNDDDYSDEEFIDETDLESYETILDTEDADIDEYVMFKNTLFGKI